MASIIQVSFRREDDVLVFSNEKGEDVALKLPKTGRVVDLRLGPYPPMSPCPYCGALNDRNHEALQHTDPFLGELI